MRKGEDEEEEEEAMEETEDKRGGSRTGKGIANFELSKKWMN